MSLGSFFKSLVGSSENEQVKPTKPIDYEGFSIEAAPINEDGKYRSAGFISGDLDGETRRIQFIRADQNADLNTAIEHSLSKARQIVDEQGQSLFKKTHL